MNENAYIKLCLKKVQEKFDLRPIDEWKDYDFNLLKKEIYSSSGVNISTDTLKRLFGKVKYKSDYNPQHATKDALAIYIGYESWGTFLKHSEEEVEGISINNTSVEPYSTAEKETGRKRIYFTYIIFITIIILAVVGLIRFNFLNPIATFSVINREGYVPHTVTFEYDISKVRSKNASIDFNFAHPVQGSEYQLAEDPQLTLINHTYQVPFIYYPKLLVDKKIIATETVVVKSNGWVVFYDQPHGIRYWVDNMFQNPVYDGYMTLARNDIARLSRDTLGIYYTTHRNIMNFGLSGDNFKFEIKFKNGPQDGGISCFDSRLSIVCEHQNFLIWMVEENCFQYCRLKYGEKNNDGRTKDLSFLARELSDWIVMKAEVVNKNFTIYMDNEKVYEGIYEQSAGNIYGLQIRFKGSGKVDYMLMTSVENDTVYFDDFMIK